jgi:hypothetical protein
MNHEYSMTDGRTKQRQIGFVVVVGVVSGDGGMNREVSLASSSSHPPPPRFSAAVSPAGGFMDSEF